MTNPGIKSEERSTKSIKRVMNASNSTEVNLSSLMMVFSVHVDNLP